MQVEVKLTELERLFWVEAREARFQAATAATRALRALIAGEEEEAQQQWRFAWIELRDAREQEVRLEALFEERMRRDV